MLQSSQRNDFWSVKVLSCFFNNNRLLFTRTSISKRAGTFTSTRVAFSSRFYFYTFVYINLLLLPAARSTADRHADDALADQRPQSTDQDDGADTLAERAFGGRMRNTYACLTCGGESARTEPFTDIPLAFPAADDATPAADAPPAADRLSVDALLAHYFATERLVGGNQYACGRCGRLRDATRTPALVRAPRCLVISLLRFSYCAATRRREKVLRDVRCPRRLGLPLLAPGGGGGATVADYALTAVVVHAGTSSDAGHYYTHARGMDAADDWALFNDSRVTPSSYDAFSRLTDRFARDTAYVLVYTRADVLPPEGATDRPLGAELRAAVERDNRLHHQVRRFWVFVYLFFLTRPPSPPFLCNNKHF